MSRWGSAEVFEQGRIELPVGARMGRFLADEGSASLLEKRILLLAKRFGYSADEEFLQHRGDETDCLHDAGRYVIGIAPCASDLAQFPQTLC